MEACETFVYSYDEAQYYMKLAIFEGICSSYTIYVWWTKLTFHDDGSGKLREIAYSSTMSMCSPVDKNKTKGAPKKGKSKVSKKDKSTKHDPSWWEYVDASVRCSDTNACSTITPSKVQQPQSSIKNLTPRQSISKVQQPRVLLFNDWLPVEIHKFINEIIDIGNDGNCEHRAIAGLLGIGENSWTFVHQQCVVDLQEFMSHYEIIYGGEIFVQKLLHSIYVEQVASMDNWMTLSEIGYVIALKFNLAFVALSLNQSQTFFHLKVNHQYLCQIIV
ncbi:uncharacterized protein [Cicer arietinum]|uniref:uncharacterized protein n=1 Tax=Cicer arietinum TaxID=3827 RepID=UPI003CC671C4